MWHAQLFSCVQLLRLQTEPPDSSAHGIILQEHWSGLPLPPPERCLQMQ